MSFEKDKFEQELKNRTQEVEIPDALKPENIEKQLQEKAGRKRHRKSVYSVAAAAACCVLLVGIAALELRKQGSSDVQTASEQTASGNAGDNESKASSDKKSVAADKKIAAAGDYDEIYKYIKAEKKRNTQYGSAKAEAGKMDSAAQNTVSGSAEKSVLSDNQTSVASDAGYSDTNVRQEGVNEGDIVKTDGKYLYILNGQKLQIVDIQTEKLKEVSTIRLEKDCYISELYVKDDRLVLVYTQSSYEPDANGYDGAYKEYTTAQTYDISNRAEPKAVGKISQSGNFYTMRVSGDSVYLFSNFYADVQATRKDVSAYIPSINGKMLDSSDILLPPYIRGSQYTVVSSFSLKNPDEKTDSKAVFGSSGLLYVSNENIYVCENSYDTEDGGGNQTCIRKVSYKEGKLEAVGQTKVDGILHDTFSIDEYKGNLRLVTTVTGNGGISPLASSEAGVQGREKSSNTLYVLDAALEEVSRIDGLAEEEQVYSARFMGDTGYFVTFRQVDPLFSVDLSNPEKPKILGELKIPGFSDYLHPYGEGLLLGIGMDVDETGTTTNGVKLSMFDISDPSAVKEIEKYVLEDVYSTSVSYNYKAELISTERNLIGFSAYGESPHYYLFSYDEKEGFQCVFDRELGGASEGRGVYSGDRLYIVAGNTVESYLIDGFQKIDDIVL